MSISALLRKIRGFVGHDEADSPDVRSKRVHVVLRPRSRPWRDQRRASPLRCSRGPPLRRTAADGCRCHGPNDPPRSKCRDEVVTDETARARDESSTRCVCRRRHRPTVDLVCADARVDGPGDDRPRPDPDVIVEIATIVTDDELEDRRRGPRPRRPPARRGAGGDGRSSSTCTPAAGCSTRSRRRRVSLEEAGAQTLAFIKEHVPEPRTGAAVRQLDRHGPSVPRRLPARDRELPALPQRRRVERSRSWPALVPAKSTNDLPQEGRQPPRPRRHPREHRASCSYYRERVFLPITPRTVRRRSPPCDLRRLVEPGSSRLRPRQYRERMTDQVGTPAQAGARPGHGRDHAAGARSAAQSAADEPSRPRTRQLLHPRRRSRRGRGRSRAADEGVVRGIDSRG